jgi:hypothetical protein
MLKRQPNLKDKIEAQEIERALAKVEKVEKVEKKKK